MIDVEQIPDAELQRAEAVLHGDAGFGFNTAVVDQLHAAALCFHYAPSHQGVARIDAQNDQKTASFLYKYKTMVNAATRNVKANKQQL